MGVVVSAGTRSADDADDLVLKLVNVIARSNRSLPWPRSAADPVEWVASLPAGARFVFELPNRASVLVGREALLLRYLVEPD